jgi:hypothetical protein
VVSKVACPETIARFTASSACEGPEFELDWQLEISSMAGTTSSGRGIASSFFQQRPAVVAVGWMVQQCTKHGLSFTVTIRPAATGFTTKH